MGPGQSAAAHARDHWTSGPLAPSIRELLLLDEERRIDAIAEGTKISKGDVHTSYTKSRSKIFVEP
jgi:hypothetical protein